jgi:hypothetical protein
MLSALAILLFILTPVALVALASRYSPARPVCSRCGIPGARVSVPGVEGPLCESCAESFSRCAWCNGLNASHPLRGVRGLLCDACYCEEIQIP